MNVTLLGPPGAGKVEFAKALAGSLPTTSPYPIVGENEAHDYFFNDTEVNLGRLADYRVELHLATSRFYDSWLHRNDDRIYIHSLLDSSIYSALRFATASLTAQDTSEPAYVRAAETLSAISSMLLDSYWIDTLLVLPAVTRDEDSDLVEHSIPILLEQLDLQDSATMLPEDREEALRVAKDAISVGRREDTAPGDQA